MKKATVMFFCTTNASRSAMAEGLMLKFAGSSFDVYSAGLNPKGVNDYVKKVMAEMDIDMSNWEPHQAADFLGEDIYSYAITLCDRSEPDCPTVFPGVINALYWPVENPETFVGTPEQTLAKYREVRDELADKIKVWLQDPKIAVFMTDEVS
jgi:arsenate reductase